MKSEKRRGERRRRRRRGNVLIQGDRVSSIARKREDKLKKIHKNNKNNIFLHEIEGKKREKGKEKEKGEGVKDRRKYTKKALAVRTRSILFLSLFFLLLLFLNEEKVFL